MWTRSLLAIMIGMSLVLGVVHVAHADDDEGRGGPIFSLAFVAPPSYLPPPPVYYAALSLPVYEGD